MCKFLLSSQHLVKLIFYKAFSAGLSSALHISWMYNGKSKQVFHLENLQMLKWNIQNAPDLLFESVPGIKESSCSTSPQKDIPYLDSQIKNTIKIWVLQPFLRFSVLTGCCSDSLHGPHHVTAACINDKPSDTADESSFIRQYWNSM